MANDKFETTYFDPKEVRRQTSQRPRKKRRKNAGLRVVIYLVSVLLVSTLLAGFGWMLANDLCAFNKPYKEATIVVTQDDSVSDVAKKLKKEGLINYKGFFKFVGKFMHASSKIDPGEYVLNTDMDYRSLIANMHDYEEDRREAEGLVRITIPEGLTVRQIIDLLAENGVAPWRSWRTPAPTTSLRTMTSSGRTCWGRSTAWRASCSRIPTTLTPTSPPCTPSTRC